MGSNFLPPIHTHENKRKIWKPVHSAISLPTQHMPQNKACSSPFDSSSWKDLSPFSPKPFLWIEKCHISILASQELPELLSTVQSPCERWSRGDPLALEAELPRAGGQASPILTWDSPMARTHPVSAPAMPGTLGATGVTQALSTARRAQAPEQIPRMLFISCTGK